MSKKICRGHFSLLDNIEACLRSQEKVNREWEREREREREREGGERERERERERAGHPERGKERKERT